MRKAIIINGTRINLDHIVTWYSAGDKSIYMHVTIDTECAHLIDFDFDTKEERDAKIAELDRLFNVEI